MDNTSLRRNTARVSALALLALVAAGTTVTAQAPDPNLDGLPTCSGWIMFDCIHYHPADHVSYYCYVYKSGGHPYHLNSGCTHI